jgi:predicted lysophospholipase L1 biosynthesis ABC-type transport system permease subunit
VRGAEVASRRYCPEWPAVDFLEADTSNRLFRVKLSTQISAHLEGVVFLQQAIDRLFVILFARERRSPNVTTLDEAWERAWYRVTGYVAVGAISVFGLIGMLAEWLLRVPLMGNPFLLMTGVAAGVYMALLRRRYRQFRSTPVAIGAAELPQERSFVASCRVAVGMALMLTAGLAAIHGFVIR